MSINNPYIRKTFYVLALGLLIVLMIRLKLKQSHQICEKVIVLVRAPLERELITEQMITTKLSDWYSNGLYGVEASDIPLGDLEFRLEELPAVKNAEVSFDLRGELVIDIEQRIPIVRFMPRNGDSYYLSLGNVKIPSSTYSVARVPIVNGSLNSQMIKKVYTLSTHVYENPFMEALVEQIFVTNIKDLVIVPKVKNQRIIIGDAVDIEVKFQKLIDFYQHGLNHIGWDKYRIINLKYKNQIVCK